MARGIKDSYCRLVLGQLIQLVQPVPELVQPVLVQPVLYLYLYNLPKLSPPFPSVLEMVPRCSGISRRRTPYSVLIPTPTPFGHSKKVSFYSAVLG